MNKNVIYISNSNRNKDKALDAWFVVEPRDNPRREIDSLIKVNRSVIEVDLDSGKVNWINLGRFEK